jgi:hypothetical protein
MSNFEINIDASNGTDFEFAVNLDGTRFVIALQWNERMQWWVQHVYTAKREPILMGKRVCVDYPMLRRSPGENRPAGELRWIDTSGKLIDPGKNDLGDRVKLVYRQDG